MGIGDWGLGVWGGGLGGGRPAPSTPTPHPPPHTKKRPPRRRFFLFFAYSAAGAPTGQVSAHAPHSMQVSGSITYLSAPSEIASTGHSAAQAPQEMHSSEILYAMNPSSFFCIFAIIVA